MSETTEVPTTPGLPDPTLPEGDPVTAPDNPAEELEPGSVGDPSDPSGPVDPSTDEDDGNDGA